MKKPKINLDTAKREYKEKMKVLMPNHFMQKELKEKTLIEKIDSELDRVKKEIQNSSSISVRQFWTGKQRALEWIRGEMNKDASV